MHEGFWSLMPSLVAIFLAILTRQVHLSLLLGLWMGYTVLAGGDPLRGAFDTVSGCVDTFSSASNTNTVLFTLLVGALIALIRQSGGMRGFLSFITRYISSRKSPQGARTRVQHLAAIAGMLLFIESNISILTVGTLFRPLFEHLKIAREKLAYICDSSAAPSCILLPFNAWGAYIMAIFVGQGIQTPLPYLMHATLFNFYPMLALLLLFAAIAKRRDIGPMRYAQARAETNASRHGLAKESPLPQTAADTHEKARPKTRNMLLPLSCMILAMPCFMVYTGWDAAVLGKDMSFFQKLSAAFLAGSGSRSVLLAVISALGIALLSYRAQRLCSLRKMLNTVGQGGANMLSLAFLMVLAFALGNLCKELNTGLYLTEMTQHILSAPILPALLFILSCLVSFSTGTSWGTFAIVLPLAFPMSEALDANIHVCVAAVLGGSVFGDHCSPISDTTLISSMASSCSHVEHVRTQLPYALLAGTSTLLLYLVLGFSMRG